MASNRYVKVRFFAPGLIMDEVYDRESPEDMACWRMNQQLYPCQFIETSATPMEG